MVFIARNNSANQVYKAKEPLQDNITIFQAFEWYVPGPSTASTTPSHYSLLTNLLPHLSELGISHVWLPPGCKASNPQDNGYAVYDLWDLGEFDAKGNRGTKWGTKQELEVFCAKAKDLGIGVLWDAVLNHKAAADAKEPSRGVKVDPKGMNPCLYSANLTIPDRTKEISKPHDLDTWTSFSFPGRKGKYSDMQYDWTHFTAVDYDSRGEEHGIFRFVDKGERGSNEWAKDVSDELGNYDYLYAKLQLHATSALIDGFHLVCSSIWITHIQQSARISFHGLCGLLALSAWLGCVSTLSNTTPSLS
jgi:alpha-amylase